jgi:acyl-ACP thioesterase
MDGSDLTWKEQITVPAHTIDLFGKVKFYYICYYLFDSASRHAHSLHWGYDDLQGQKQYWVLSRLHVQMLSYPGMHDSIMLETWPKGISRLFALRDFKITSANGETICLATTAWLIVDGTTGRPVRISDFARLYNFNTGRHSLKTVPGKLPVVDDPEHSLEIGATYSDLDINQHVTSGKYIEWVQNCFDTGSYEKTKITEFRMNFLSETRHAENITLHWMAAQPPESGYYFEGIKGSYDHPVFRAYVKMDELSQTN